MIVMLALLNDGAILSIAYDNVIYRMKPEAWDLRTVLGISTVLGVVGVISALDYSISASASSISTAPIYRR
jgi:H+-transporting ATPase